MEYVLLFKLLFILVSITAIENKVKHLLKVIQGKYLSFLIYKIYKLMLSNSLACTGD